MATPAAAAPYDDGSSTESEYYFDPREEAEEEAAFAWTHAQDEPLNEATTVDNTVIKQEYSDYDQLQHTKDDIALPCGSEWSHGGESTVYDIAVQQALEMAQEFTNGQGEAPLTDDTMNSTSSPIATKVTRATVLLKKTEEVTVKPKVISLKSVKKTLPPPIITKSVAVGLRSSPRNAVGEPSEMHRELSVARSQWKTPTSQSSSQKSPSNKDIKAKEKEKIEKQGRKSEQEKVSSSRRTEHSKSQDRRYRSPSVRRRRSPSIRDAARKRSTSPVRYSSKRSRSRSPQSRRYNERSRSRPRSRSPYRSSNANSSSRSYRSVQRVSSPRQYESERRSSRTYKRSRSPSPPYRSTHIRYSSRSRSRSRDRDGRRRDFSRDHYDNGGRSSDYTTGRDFSSRHSSRTEYISTSSGSRSSDEPTVRESSSYGKKQRVDHEIGKRSDQKSSGINRSASKPRLHDSESLRSRRSKPNNVVVSTSKPDIAQSSKRSPRDPRIRESSVAPQDDDKKRRYVYHDAFERRVFKLKLQEADVNEKVADGRLTRNDEWFYNQRRENMAAERARLEAENLERFENLYNSTQVTSSDLKRYQTNRDFAARVVRYKKDQASLQEQNNLFLSSETQNALRHRLEKEREELMTENSYMFHQVMMDTELPAAPFNNKSAGGLAKFTNYDHVQAHLSRRSITIPMRRQSNSTANSRVVVGASLQLQSDHDIDNFKIPPAIAGNTPWFLKG